jgi:hypothetical protein
MYCKHACTFDRQGVLCSLSNVAPAADAHGLPVDPASGRGHEEGVRARDLSNAQRSWRIMTEGEVTLTSAGAGIRFCGCAFAMCSRANSGTLVLNASVVTAPGATTLTVMRRSGPVSVGSRARARIVCSIAPLVAMYGIVPGGIEADSDVIAELVKMIRPSARMCGARACVRKNGPKKFVPTICK